MSNKKQQSNQGKPSSDEQAKLQDDVQYWQNKVSDLCLDFETLKGEAELDDEAIMEDQERLERELASVQNSLKRLHFDNSHLNQSIHEKSQDIQRQEVQIRSNADDIDKTKSQLDDLIADDKRRSEAPDLTVQEYAMQLADRADTVKLQQLSAATYQKISMLVSQQQIMQMAQMYQQMNPDGTPMATENGHHPQQQQQPAFQQQFPPQMNGQMAPNGGFPMAQGGPQAGFPQMFNPMAGYPSAMMTPQGQQQQQQPGAPTPGAYMPQTNTNASNQNSGSQKTQSQSTSKNTSANNNRSRKNKQRAANNN